MLSNTLGITNMCSLKEIKRRSESNDELVLGYTDAMELLHIYEQNAIQVLGWEGWLKFDNGFLGHSLEHQGTTDLSAMPPTSALALVKSSIMQAHVEWKKKPEASNANLLFCITVNV